VRVVVVGASSGLGRCIGVGLAKRGDQVALLARRLERLTVAAKEAGPGSLAIRCDVTDERSCREAVEEAAGGLGGIDAVVYATAVGPLARIEDVSSDRWQHTFATNVTGASLVTAAALPHLKASSGVAAYLSSVSASLTEPWPGLGAYIVSKAALEKLIEAWRVEHPSVGFSTIVVGDCAGGEGDSATGFIDEWDLNLAAEMHPIWMARSHLSGNLLTVDELVEAVDNVLRLGATSTVSSIVVRPRRAT